MGGPRKKGEIKRFFQKLHNPPNWVAVITTATTLVVCPLIIFSVLFDHGHTMYAIIASVICGGLILYTVAVTVNSIIKFRKKVLRMADKYEFTRNLSKSYEFRTIFFGICSFLCNLGYTVFLIVTAFYYRSVWYGTIGIYYIVLSITRGGVLIQSRKDERRYRTDYRRLQKAKVGTYRYCGVMMLALALSLVFSVVELVIDSSGFRHPVWFIYIFAPVAVYKVVHGLIHFVHSTKRDDLVVRSVRYINLAVTLMSLLCLQTAIVAVLPIKTVTVGVLNGMTGAIVCIITLLLGLYMLFFSKKEKRRLLVREAVLAEAVEEWEPEGYNRDGYVEEYETGSEKLDPEKEIKEQDDEEVLRGN